MRSFTDEFDKQAIEFRDFVALADRDGERQMTYGEVDLLRRRAATKIRDAGLIPGDAVIIYMERCSEYLIAYLGIISAGCAAIPLTTEYPEERVDFIKKDSGAKLTITEEFFSDISDYFPAIVFDIPEDTPSHITYTSGSTGKPKGVVHTVKSMYRMVCEDNIDVFGIGERPVCAQATTFSFMLSVYDTLGVLALGGEVHILSDEVRKDTRKLAEYYVSHNINCGVVSPQMIKNFRVDSPHLKRLVTGGEVLCNVYSEEYEILNVYGSTETGLVSTFPVDKKYPSTPIGRPFVGCEFVLIPDAENPVPDEGELGVICECAREYLNLPEQSGKTFEILEDGRTMYHTGDCVRRGPDGNYLFLNRMDWMVKINGQRVETLGVEANINAIPGINASAVKAFTDEDGQNYLCAYYVTDGSLSGDDIRSLLARKLPPYMIPRFFVKTDALPLTMSNKIDRTQLMPPSAEDFKKEYAAPKSNAQNAICHAFSEVLRCGQVGISDNFFSLGGDSIKVLRLTECLSEKHGINVSPAEILAAKTPEKIAELIGKRNNGDAPAQETHADGTGLPAFIPLTESQRGVYLECMEKPESTIYNIPFAVMLPEDTDIDRFEKAVKDTAEKHPALFVKYDMRDGEPVMIPGKPDVNVSRTETNSTKTAKKYFVRPFDLSEGPLYRFELCTTPKGTLFLIDVHHTVFDGSSLRVFLQQVSDAYDGKEIPFEQLSLFDVAESEKTLKETDSYRNARAFFEEQFGDVEFDNEIPYNTYNRNVKECSVLTVPFPEGTDRSAVEKFARDSGVTESTLFTAAFAYTLSAFLGTKDSCFTTVNSGRHDHRLADTVGMFVKTLPLHFEIPEKGSVSGFISLVQDTLYKTMEHDCISFGELVSGYGINSDVSFVYQSELMSEITVGGTQVTPEELPVSECVGNLVFMALKTANGYEIRGHYRKSLYTSGMVNILSQTVFQVLSEMICRENLEDIVLTNGIARRFINASNNTDKPYDKNETICSVINRRISEMPEKEVLVYRDRRYSFAQFDRVTKRIAGYISGKGIGKDDFVAVLGPRNDVTVLVAWGALRAGAGFQPLDPTYPSERLNYMLHDSKAKLLVADRSLANLVDGYTGNVLFFDQIPKLAPADSLPAKDSPDGAAALIYTSGTTGNPKGCVLENRNLLAFCLSHMEKMDMDCDSHIASYASFGFDAGVMDIVSVPMMGACVYIIPDEIRLDIAKVEEFYRENAITHGFMTTQVGRMFAEETKCETLRTFLVGGEKLVPFNPQNGFRFVNGYGPCETMAYICSYDVKDNSPLQPIGKPCINTKLYVTDGIGRLLPPGAIGELCISGKQTGRGYLGLPEMTAKVFTANTFDSAEGYERIYRTGDIVRLLPDGNYEFIGRRDGQVKIRGFRIELTEVEEVVRRFDGVRDATVAAFDDPNGGKFIAAYVVSDRQINTADLNAFIKAEKPPYMVPAVTMQIDAIPYNQNQKVNRRALPAPDLSAASCGNGSEETVAPKTAAQRKVFDIAAKILGHENFGITSDLFDAGMTSIGTLKFNVELGKAFDRPVKITDLRENSTVETLAEFLCPGSTDAYDGGSGKAETGPAPVLETAQAQDTVPAEEPAPAQKPAMPQAEPQEAESYPLMLNQLGVLLDAGMDAETTKYNIPVLFEISNDVDIDRLKAAISLAIDAHPYIKATLSESEPGYPGEVRVIRHDGDEAVVDIVNAGELPGTAELVRPFEMFDSRLYRASIYITKDRHYLFLDIHHIVSDGTSVAILINDINKAYGGNTPEKEYYTGFDAAAEEERITASPEFGRSGEYYDTLLSGCNTESVPGKCPEKDAQPDSCAEHSVSFGSCSEKILDYCKTGNVTANAFFNAVFSYTLSEFIHSDDITYCTVYNGRNDSRLMECFSMLVKTLPVRCFVDTKTKVSDFVAAMQKQLIGTMSNDAVSFASLSAKYGIKSDLFFNYQGDNFIFDTIGGEKAKAIDIGVQTAKAPLTVEVFLENGIFSAKATYRTDCYCKEFVSSFTDALICAAENFTGADTLSGVSVFSENEKKIFDAMNDTYAPAEDVPMHVFFERTAAENPDAVAVKTADTSITYRQLNEMSNAVASSLISMGVNYDEIIGIILDRNEYIPVAELGILKAGCAYLPMLPSYPDNRLDYCMNDAKCRFVLSTNDIIDGRRELFAENKNYRPLSIESLTRNGDIYNSSTPVGPNNLAYCIYTSGSTGTPKGVMIEHHSLSNYVQTVPLKRIIDAGSTVMCMASISFDLSASEIHIPLCMGKTLYIASEEEIHNFDLLLSAFRNNDVDVVMMTPSFAWNLLSVEKFESAFSQLKGIMLAAEAFQPALFGKFKALNPDMIILNGYGPTECTQGCSFKTITDGSDITIGGPNPNMKYYVFDSSGNLLPRYAVGELMICGEGVGRGYVNLPEKTAAAFTEIDGVRAYHSGDMVRINKNLEAEFGGRADNQVKLRGYRVELDEIENVMQEYPGITQSKVIVRNNGTEDYLAAFFTAGTQIDTGSLTEYMKTKLTYYMIPAAMMQLEKMPMTPNGKLDKKALPEITPAKKERIKRAPKKSLEEKILEVFRSVLNIDECYIDDNFFEIGGTSLSASKAVMQIKADGYKIEYQDIFDHQNAAELAEYLESLGTPASDTYAGEEEALYTQDAGTDELLKYNSMEYADRVERKPLGDVLLTGASGFLGIHILRALLEANEGRIICLLRKGNYDDIIQRMKATLVYYFDNDYAEEFGKRIVTVEGDITDGNLSSLFADTGFDTLINCAACVKHYANDNSIEYVNVHGVENLIGLAKEKNARMIQISTTSIPGVHNDETYKINLKMTENRLFVIDDMNNQYCQSKYKAELLMLDAIKDGMKGKIIRVGNLMGRYSDGEFQTNMRTNAFLNGLRGFANIGKCPISHSTDPMGFSPIDCTARAVVLLAGTNDMFTAFHADSRYTFDEMKLIEAANRCGITITPVPDKEYYDDFNRMMADDEMNERVSGLLTNDRPDLHMVSTDNRFTANILYRLGFSWPFIDDEYLQKVIENLDAFDFFFM